MFPGKQFSGPSETGRNLIEYQQKSVLTTQGRCLHQIPRMIEAHASCSLNHRFENQSGQLFMMLFNGLPQRQQVGFQPLPAKLRLRCRNKVTHRKCLAEQTVHSGHRIADRHGIPGIPVIAGADGHEIGLFRVTGSYLILNGHLQGYFYSHRTAVGIEYVLHGGRCQRKQFLSQGNGRFMSQSAKHDMSHAVQLLFDGPVQHRMIVPVYGTPPGRHSLNQACTVFQFNRTPFRAPDLIGRKRIQHRRIGMPQMLPVEVINNLFITHNLPPLSVLRHR
jgi:hypothetical protein